MRTILLGIIIFFIIAAITKEDREKGYTPTTTAKIKAPMTVEELQRKNGYYWRYTESIDKMSGKTTKSARVKSTTGLRLKFPYNGVQWMTLQVRKHPRWGNHVILYVDKGQFYGDTITVRFDNGKPLTYKVTDPADNSSEMIFIASNYEKGFLRRLKKSSKVFISTRFYQNGNHVSEFRTKDLKW